MAVASACKSEFWLEQTAKWWESSRQFSEQMHQVFVKSLDPAADEPAQFVPEAAASLVPVAQSVAVCSVAACSSAGPYPAPLFTAAE